MMPGKTHSFQGNENIQSGNELASGNKFFFNIDGMAIAMVVGFCIVLASAALIWLIVSHGGLVAFMVVAGFILLALVGVGAAVTAIVCYALKSVSATRAQLVEDTNRQQWSKHVYPVANHVVIHDPRTGQLTVHNARDVSEVRHFNDKPQIAAPSTMKLDDDDAFSQVLNRNISNGNA